MKTFAVILVNKKTYNAYFNTIEAADYVTAQFRAAHKWRDEGTVVFVIPPELIREQLPRALPRRLPSVVPSNVQKT